MQYLEIAQGLMAELGPLLDGIDIVQIGEDSWLLGRVETEDDRQVLAIDYHDNEERLVLSCGAGRIAGAGSAEAMRTLLTFNGQWRATGGARMALDDGEGDVILLLDVNVEGLDAARLASIVTRFLEVQTGWQAYLAGLATQSGDDDRGRDHLDRAAFGAIRA